MSVLSACETSLAAPANSFVTTAVKPVSGGLLSVCGCMWCPSCCRCALEMQKTNGSLATFLWSFVPEGKPLQNECETSKDVPTT